MEISHLTEKAQYDYKLIQRCLKDNDQKAYAELMGRYRDSLYFMMLKMTDDPMDAEDMTIEAFTKAFKNLESYTTDFAFSTWLFRIAANNCIDFLRRKNKYSSVSIDEAFFNEDINENAQTIKSEDLDPEETVMKKQRHKQVRELVEKLKPHYKRLIELRYYEEKSYEEIAVELDLPLGTVKAQLFRAREFLYNFLKNNPNFL